MAIVTIAVDNERLDDNNRLLIKNEEHNDVQRNSRSFCEGFSVGARQHSFLRFTATPSSHKLGHVPRELLRPHGGQVHARVPCPCAVMAGHGGDRPRARAAVALVSAVDLVEVMRCATRAPAWAAPTSLVSSEARHSRSAGTVGAHPAHVVRLRRPPLLARKRRPESGSPRIAPLPGGELPDRAPPTHLAPVRAS